MIDKDTKEVLNKIAKLSEKELKEVDVREEIINPLMKILGYENLKGNIIRENRFETEIIIGTKKKKYYYYPDYLFITKKGIKWILEAKSSKEKIDNKVFNQAYSYAINENVNAKMFVICNGREFAIYSLKKRKMIFKFKLQHIKEYYLFLRDFISYETFNDNEEFQKDLGLYLMLKGYDSSYTFEFTINVRLIDIINKKIIYVNIPVTYDNKTLFATFKISKEIFVAAHNDFKNMIKFAEINNNYPITINTSEIKVEMHFLCKLSVMEEAEKEIFTPLEIIEILEVNMSKI